MKHSREKFTTHQGAKVFGDALLASLGLDHLCDRSQDSQHLIINRRVLANCRQQSEM